MVTSRLELEQEIER